MANDNLRRLVLEEGIYKAYAKARRNTYLGFEVGNLNDFECNLSDEYGPQWYEIVEECKRIGNSSYQRIKRLKERIKCLMHEGKCLFLTLTFNPETLNNTTSEYRRQLVIDFLKATNSQYIANIDFGKENEREHYHAIIQSHEVDYTLWHPFGAVKGEKVHLRANCETKLAKYIDKLALHSIKDTTHKNRLIYSRRLEKWEDDMTTSI